MTSYEEIDCVMIDSNQVIHFSFKIFFACNGTYFQIIQDFD